MFTLCNRDTRTCNCADSVQRQRKTQKQKHQETTAHMKLCCGVLCRLRQPKPRLAGAGLALPSRIKDLDEQLDLQGEGAAAERSLSPRATKHIDPTPRMPPPLPRHPPSSRHAAPAACTQGSRCGSRRPQTWPGRRPRRARGGRTARAPPRAGPPSTRCSSRRPPLHQPAAGQWPAARAAQLVQAQAALAGRLEPAGSGCLRSRALGGQAPEALAGRREQAGQAAQRSLQVQAWPTPAGRLGMAAPAGLVPLLRLPLGALLLSPRAPHPSPPRPCCQHRGCCCCCFRPGWRLPPRHCQHCGPRCRCCPGLLLPRRRRHCGRPASSCAGAGPAAALALLLLQLLLLQWHRWLGQRSAQPAAEPGLRCWLAVQAWCLAPHWELTVAARHCCFPFPLRTPKARGWWDAGLELPLPAPLLPAAPHARQPPHPPPPPRSPPAAAGAAPPPAAPAGPPSGAGAWQPWRLCLPLAAGQPPPQPAVQQQQRRQQRWPQPAAGQRQSKLLTKVQAQFTSCSLIPAASEGW